MRDLMKPLLSKSRPNYGSTDNDNEITTPTRCAFFLTAIVTILKWPMGGNMFLNAWHGLKKAYTEKAVNQTLGLRCLPILASLTMEYAGIRALLTGSASWPGIITFFLLNQTSLAITDGLIPVETTNSEEYWHIRLTKEVSSLSVVVSPPSYKIAYQVADAAAAEDASSVCGSSSFTT